MEAAGGGRDKASPQAKPSKFSVYQNPALSAALTVNSLRPSRYIFLYIFFITSASALAFLSLTYRENGFIGSLKLKSVSEESAYFLAKAVQTVVGLVLIGSIFALCKAISLRRARLDAGILAMSAFKGNGRQASLSNRQLGLLGIKPKTEAIHSDASKKPPKSKSFLTSSPSEALVPLHPPINSPSPSRKSADKSSSSNGNKIHSITTPSKSGGSSPLYLVPGVVSPLPSSSHTSHGLDQVASTPWSGKRAASGKEISSEEELERFLAMVDEKITESAGKLATPPPTVGKFGIASPNTLSSSANASGTTRSTPLRSVRMSPSAQKFTTPPKKGEGELPPAMSLEESIEAFEQLGIYPQIEQWRDRLRQWFSSILLKPLLNKIETSHIKVMQLAAKLNITVSISQVGSDPPTTGTASVPSADRSKDWQPTLTLDEDGLLHQLRATLLQSIDASTKLLLTNMQQSPQQNSLISIMQKCVDAIAEHQRLLALMKGEWVKGLLPQSSIRADYAVQRIRELAEGTCLKNYEYLGSGEVYDKKTKKWTLELPTDSHLLLYLFCAFLEHPKWMLHVDPTSSSGAQSSRNPLFLGALPPKERFPEKYIAVISGVPSVLHPGACILAVGRQSPPIFALYWDKKPHFSLQGRTALWDSVLLLCHKIRVGYGGIVRGMHLGSSALSILPVLESEADD